MCNPCIGTPIDPSNAYTNQLPYTGQPRESQFDGAATNHLVLPVHNRIEGVAFGHTPAHMPVQEYYTSQQLHGSGHENTQPRPRNQDHAMEPVDGDTVVGVPAAMGQVNSGQIREVQPERDPAGGRVHSNTVRGPESGRQTSATLGRQALHPSASVRTASEGGASRNLRDSKKAPSPVMNTNNSPTLLSTTSSKSSPPSTMSQRKQLRVEEKSYLKEVKRSIAEGRVPQVRLQQNHHGAIVQYKAQFLNALKLAALAIVPSADIDIKNPCTMQEIMKEVKRQFIIEKPLPAGMVEGYLQRLYKRNRAVYHRHWLLHGDHSKPDDCASAAWLQLVDYWKSLEGSRECERNKANASSKKSAAVRHRILTLTSGQLAAMLCVTSTHGVMCDSIQSNTLLSVGVIVGEAQKCMQR